MTASAFVPDLVGIDLGTTHSLVAYWRDGASHLIPNALGQTLTPSVVSLDEDGSVLVGVAARERLQSHPDRTVASFKRGMGRMKALVDPGFIARREQAEADFRARVAADPALAARVGDPWGDLAAVQDDYRDLFPAYHMLEIKGGGGSNLYTWAETLVRGAVERAKPEAVEKARADHAERRDEADRLAAALARLG